MSTEMSLLSMRQLCFFTHYPPFVKAAEVVRLALVVRQQSEEAVDADDIELVRELLLVGTHGSPDVEQLDELLFMLEGERESVSDAFRHCAVGVVRTLVLGNERLLSVYVLMTYLVAGGVLYCDFKCEWPNDEWAVEDNEPRRAVLEARRDECADWLQVLDWRFDMSFARGQIGALERAALVELAVGLAPLALPVLLVLAVGEWCLRCDLGNFNDRDGLLLRNFKMSTTLRWRIAALVQHF